MVEFREAKLKRPRFQGAFLWSGRQDLTGLKDL